MRIFIISSLLAIFVLAAAIYSSIGRIGGSFDDLDAVHLWVAQQFPDVAHISPDDLGQQIGQGGGESDFVIFDVRESEEFAVSHIAGAQQVTPGMSADEFIRRFGMGLKGKTAIFYCSVGYRSSRLANRVSAALRGRGAKASYNLTGGLFNWHNQKGALVNMADKTTRAIHPYSKEWGRHIVDNAAVSFTPIDGK